MSTVSDIDKTIAELRQNSSIVSTAFRLAATDIDALKHAVVLFAESNERLVKRLCELEAIVPRIVDVDGRKIRWDAPDDAIPVSNF